MSTPFKWSGESVPAFNYTLRMRGRSIAKAFYTSVHEKNRAVTGLDQNNLGHGSNEGNTGAVEPSATNPAL